MNDDPTVDDIQHEILIAKFHPKRISSLVFYVFGFIVFIVGWVFMIASSVQFVEFSLVAWIAGICAMAAGIGTIIWREVKRRYTLYIITSWNVRVRKGYLKKRTTRVFYDDISDVRIIANIQDRIVNQGDIQIFANGEDEPAIIFYSIENPRGIYELIQRMLRTVQAPYPWSHIEKTRVIYF